MSRGREIGIFAFVALGAAAVGAGITFFVAHKNQAKNNCGDRRVYDARVADEAGSARVYRIQTGQRRGALTER